jgi:hypothetical protein
MVTGHSIARLRQLIPGQEVKALRKALAEASAHLERIDQYADAAACPYCNPRLCGCGHLESCPEVHFEPREKAGDPHLAQGPAAR